MTQIPSKEQILQWIADNPALTAKRDIAKAFGIKDTGRIELKRLLKELEPEPATVKPNQNQRKRCEVCYSEAENWNAARSLSSVRNSC